MIAISDTTYLSYNDIYIEECVKESEAEYKEIEDWRILKQAITLKKRLKPLSSRNLQVITIYTVYDDY